jgi:hypothetical protein
VSALTVKLATKLLPALIQDIEILENFEEILTAVGGAHKLVSLVLKHISLAIAFRESEAKVALLADLLLFLVSTSNHGGFLSGFLSHKVITAPVSSLNALLPTAVHSTLAGHSSRDSNVDDVPPDGTDASVDLGSG